ncbi:MULTISPECIES: T9SS type A sorting domain-containing protein [Aequorivita]|uniref:T9SS type A sorting domain-containing protein n=1 Tax=Aequorivita iocasae TaxID=2803865 RepID=A0ABX7DND4_9FLAO|nr:MULTISPECIES: T9SS type A sorting domain-containing protein [Aequorivita]QQX75605.1 T9SS type A sorting domain-containing protein [Aequorivita iocasae]UCA55059.1 T9SS type A sorting domain-containing protein [Aequorivita sp. F7]
MKNILLFLLVITPNIIFAQINGYQSRSIQGFEVYVLEEALNNHPQETNEAIDLLTTKLAEIVDFGLKEEILEELRLVKIFMDWNTTNGSAVYHPYLQWLIDNGYIVEKWKSIEISNINNFINWTELNQPFMVMHEMAHAYHHRVLGFTYAPILQAYNSAMQSGLYDSVLYHAGNGVYYYREAYAATNEMEYFAELTEAYLGENDFYPFIREELETHDPVAYAILVGIWQFEQLGVEDNKYTDVVLYPNPTDGLITLKWNNTWRAKTLKIITLEGKVLLEQDTNATGDTTLNIANLAAGMYVLVLDNLKTYKIVKAH